MEEKKEKVKKPFYKKGWFILLVGIILLIIVNDFKEKIENMPKKFDWDEIELSELLPEVESAYGEIKTNRSDLAIIEVAKIDKKSYKNYVQECIEKGYSLDLEYEPWDTVYGAFNKDGYSIRIIYSENNEEISITLKTPEKDTMTEIEWPNSDLAKILPIPKSNFGKIFYNSSNSYIIHLGNTNINDYNDYVKKCEEMGFVVDYSKSEKAYSAKDTNGNELKLMYLGANIIEISIKASETNIANTGEKNETENKETVNEVKLVDGMRPEFKAAMDSYENFMNEYCDFMKKYANSDGNDLTLMQDYADYVKKYSEFVDDFAKWEDDTTMNSKETTYYIDVQARVNKKIIEVTQ